MGNPKKRAEKAEAAKGRKDEVDAKKKEAEESEKWSKGIKSNNKKEQEEEKRRLAAQKKAERTRLEQEEMASIPSKGGKGKKAGARKDLSLDAFLEEPAQPASYSASNIDDALNLLSLDSGSKEKIDRHPERRFKPAFNEYKESRLPELRKESPGLRLNQYEDVMYREFQKHPNNPFNKLNVSYNTKQDDIKSLRAARKAELEARLRE
ncbi:HMG-box [Schizosaccharomyces cryophilus OY26]|uniref:HMG-box n=1 Tax=Schizosaccharomyces cryophilus (strain OY26 / ATCC MYA-4695 / CBS 11777 / NBRC 106824 / NRRL Y48691) TaxID=653667 RepID=S9XCQ0_SCHCR|nr:HMG-box [Schizosaccharomyces cryophilus OY26]EPY51631.1 HMG-box [Schizosaccharomyces cryophilus OY26]